MSDAPPEPTTPPAPTAGPKRAKSKRTGRIPLLTSDVHAALVKALEDGAPRDLMAESVGVSRSTLFAWLARGRKDRSGPFRELADAVKRVEAKLVTDACAKIRTAGDKSWQALAWWLERRYPDLFGANRNELADLRKQINDLRKELDARDGS